MDSQNQRNMILAIVMTALILFGWDIGMRYLYPNANKAKAKKIVSAPLTTPEIAAARSSCKTLACDRATWPKSDPSARTLENSEPVGEGSLIAF